MKRTLFQSIVKESIDEGGNAVPSAQPSRGDLAGEIAKGVTNEVSSTFNREEEPAYSTSLSERLETLKLNINDVRKIAKSLVNEYRERKSYQKPEDAEFIERMNQFCKKYGYEPFTYSRKQGLDPEEYAKKILKRHNTFLRGVTSRVNTDDKELQAKLRTFARKKLKEKGIREPSEEDIARIAATIPSPENGSNFCAVDRNADIYSGTNHKGGFSGTAKVIRPYTLGADRMKWFDEADFNVRYGQPNKYDKENTAGLFDYWNDSGEARTRPATENVFTGEWNFDGWLTPEERAVRNMEGMRDNELYKRFVKEREKILQAGLPQDKREMELNKLYKKYKKHGFKPGFSYDDFLTSKNSYYRGDDN
jgi:hypothetical protein